MLGWLRKLLGVPARTVRVIRARYDAAQTTPENRRHWAMADALSARTANSLAVRKPLRERARYEAANNGYVAGLVDTLVNEVVGAGPRLQMRTGDRAADQQIEADWAAWAREVRLVRGLRCTYRARVVDGEGLALLATEEALRHPVKLFPVWFECDQLTDPAGRPPALAPGAVACVDGVQLSRTGRPVAYHVLRDHPGDGTPLSAQADLYPADRVLHWFRADRPGQVRGVPEITPGLPLVAQLRRYTLAVLTAAETAAMFAALLESTLPGDGADPLPDMDVWEIVRGMMTALPQGYKATQMKAEQPATTYKDFKGELLREFGRPLHVPFSIAAGDSSNSSFSSNRHDRLILRLAVAVVRGDCEADVLDPIFAEWWREYRRQPDSPFARLPDEPPAHRWFWPGTPAVDPDTEAKADTEALVNGTTTLSELLAETGQDWEDVVRQRAAEIALCQELGVPLPQKAGTAAPAAADQGAAP